MNAQGENAWVFVNEECIAASVKAYFDFEKKLLEKYPREKRKEMKPTAISGKPLLSPDVHNCMLLHVSLQHIRQTVPMLSTTLVLCKHSAASPGNT